MPHCYKRQAKLLADATQLPIMPQPAPPAQPPRSTPVPYRIAYPTHNLACLKTLQPIRPTIQRLPIPIQFVERTEREAKAEMKKFIQPRPLTMALRMRISRAIIAGTKPCTKCPTCRSCCAQKTEPFFEPVKKRLLRLRRRCSAANH